MRNYFLCIGLSLFCNFNGSAQSIEGDDNLFDEDKFRMNYRALSQEPVSEVDLIWQKRVIREIDVDEKLNLPFKYAKLPLINVMQTAVCTGDLKVYDADEEIFAKQLATSVACDIGEQVRIMEMINPESFELESKPVVIPLSPQSIVKYRLVEDWYFNKKTSTMNVKILSIVPVREIYSNEGIFIGYSPMYWVPYDAVKNLLANTQAYNIKNDERFLSWADVLSERIFSSRVIYESNLFDRSIASYATGVDAILESNRVGEVIFVQEHDSWSY